MIKKPRLFKYLEIIAQIIPINIYWLDINNILLGLNQRALEAIGGRHINDFVGKSPHEFHPKEMADYIVRHHIEVALTGKFFAQEESIIDPATGKIKCFNAIVAPLYDDNNEKIIGTIGASIDITAEKEAEAKLKIALEKVEIANNAKADFLSNMRHDIRTSLNGIQGFSELIREEVKNEKVDEYVANLVASCRALTSIHNQILRAIQVFSGDIPFYKNKFDLCGKLKQIIDLNLAKAGENGLQLKLICDNAIPKYLMGDCKRLSGIAQELITNALKYTENGSVTVTASLEKQQNKTVTVKFTVQDTGIGIPDDKKQEIFARFSRLTPAYEGKYAGLGLGLSIVKQLIDDLGGEIYVESEVAKGSTFICYMPFSESLSNNNIGIDNALDLQLEYDFKTKITDVRSIENINNNGYNILLVEDDNVSGKVARFICCDKLKQNLDIACNGNEALQKVKTKNYDLIFMDVGLPDISGNEVARKIRLTEKATGEHIPIIALTAHVDNENKQQCIEAGMDAVLSKPISIKKVSDMLDAFITNRAVKPVEEKESQQTDLAEDNNLLIIEGKVLDLEYIKNQLNYDDDTINTLLAVSLPEINEDKQLLLEFYNKKDWNNAKSIVHKFKGTACYIGAMRLTQVCTNFEFYMHANKTVLIEKLCELVLQESEKLLVVIADYNAGVKK